MKQRVVVSDFVILVLLVGMVLLLKTGVAQAQAVARIAAKERVTEKKSATLAPWLAANVGTTLEQNNIFRTRKRSKADILFT